MKIEKKYLRGKSLGIFISKKNSNVVINDWRDGLVFMISVRKWVLSLALSYGGSHPVDGRVWNSDFWLLALDNYLWESLPTKQEEWKLRTGARAHMTTWNKPVPWMRHICPWTFMFLERAHLEFWKSNEKDTQDRRERDERVHIYLTWGRKEPIDIFNILSSQLFRSDMPNFQTHVFYFCILGEKYGVERVERKCSSKPILVFVERVVINLAITWLL